MRYEYSTMGIKDEAEKARDLLAAAEQVAILLASRPTLDALAAAEAIVRVLVTHDKYVGFLPSITADTSSLPPAFVHVSHPTPLIRERIIAIDTTHAPIGQLRYEKHDSQIEIVLSPKSGSIREDAFSFRDGKIQCDVLIAIAVPDIEEISVEAMGLTPQFFTETPIINIGNADGHKEYGEANLLSPSGSSLSEIAATVIASVDSKQPSAETATLLLAGLMQETHGFAAPVRVDAHLSAADLLQRGADQHAAAEIAGAQRPFSLSQLIARAHVRSKETNDGKTLWSFLTAEDFEKTSRSVQDVPTVMDALPDSLASHDTRVLLWQDPHTREIRSMIAASPETLAALAEAQPGDRGNPVFVPHAVFLNFLEAEERITALLGIAR